MSVVIMMLFCPPKLSTDNDGQCGTGADTQPTLAADIVGNDIAGRQAMPFFLLMSTVGTPLSAATDGS